MVFTIESTNTALGMKGSYRLKKNGQWKEQSDFNKYSDEDMLFNNYSDTQIWLDNNPIVKINGKDISSKKPEYYTIGDHSIYSFETILHRIIKPKYTFTKEKIKNILLSGDDSFHNSFIIDYYGVPKLIQIGNTSPMNIKNCAVRYETFHAGNKYVGKDSSLCHLNDIYLALLEAWLLHLKCGRSIYKDYIEGGKSEEELLLEIDKEISKLR